MDSLTLFGTLAAFLIIFAIGYLFGSRIAFRKHEEKIPDIRQDAIKKSRAVLAGQFTEQIAPYMPDFPFKASSRPRKRRNIAPTA